MFGAVYAGILVLHELPMPKVAAPKVDTTPKVATTPNADTTPKMVPEARAVGSKVDAKPEEPSYPGL